MEDAWTIEQRARAHAALGDVGRLAIVERLSTSDRSPQELQRALRLASNLLAHHLDVLEAAGLIERSRSSGDGRRRYVHLRTEALSGLGPQVTSSRDPKVTSGLGAAPGRVLFVCTANSARSQLAAALWTATTGGPARSAGTAPAGEIHPLALAAAHRAGLDLRGGRPRHLSAVRGTPGLTITVCDRAHETLTAPLDRRHWSIPDPVPVGTDAAFDATVAELRWRIAAAVAT